jgi:hypothetical protein
MVETQVHQTERFFLLGVEPLEFNDEVREEHSREGILDTRWWSLADLSNSSETIFPKNLAEIVGRATRGQRPSN